MSNTLSDLPKRYYRYKKLIVDQNFRIRELFLTICCPICPLFEGSRNRNLLVLIALSIVHALEADKVIFQVISFLSQGFLTRHENDLDRNFCKFSWMLSYWDDRIIMSSILKRSTAFTACGTLAGMIISSPL